MRWTEYRTNRVDSHDVDRVEDRVDSDEMDRVEDKQNRFG